jgi:hypothetical protein
LVLAVGSGCGSRSPEPPIGTWTFSGSVPAQITIALTFKADGTFSAAEQVAPPTTPVGSAERAAGCTTTDTFSGTYDVATSSGVNTLTWTYAAGTVNVVAGCDDPSFDRPGTSATPDGIDAYTAQNILPPSAEAYAETETTLVLTPGFRTSTTFTKVP